MVVLLIIILLYSNAVAAPSVNILFSTRNVTIGQNVTVQCAITTNYGRPTDIEVTPHISWDIESNENDEIVMETLEDVQLTMLTTAVFTSELQYNPILATRTFTCRSYVEPLVPNLLVRQSDTNFSSKTVNPRGKICTIGSKTLIEVYTL